LATAITRVPGRGPPAAFDLELLAGLGADLLATGFLAPEAFFAVREGRFGVEDERAVRGEEGSVTAGP